MSINASLLIKMPVTTAETHTQLTSYSTEEFSLKADMAAVSRIGLSAPSYNNKSSQEGADL